MPRFFLLATLAATLAAQSGPAFEVASLKAVPPNSPLVLLDLEWSAKTEAHPLRARTWVARLLWEAFDLPSYRFANTKILPENQFEIDVVVPANTTREQFRAMVLNLLAERFHLRYHRETQEIKSYELQVANGGPKLKPSAGPPKDPPQSTRPTAGPDGYLTFPPGFSSPNWGNGPRFTVQKIDIDMDGFARDVIEDWYKSPVVNRTGLTGKYDIYFRWNAANANPAALKADDPASLELPFVPALREQLGLLLREFKGPGEMIVIDAIDKVPEEN